MQDIIASYLVQKKECGLPGIGHFKITIKAAEHNTANKLIDPPGSDIVFTEEEVHLRKDLVSYVSQHQHANESDAAESINRWCGQAKAKLASGEHIYFPSLGSLEQHSSGIYFHAEKSDLVFFESVSAQRAMHKNDEHAVIVGDRERTSAEMSEFFRTDPVLGKRTSWKIWAIALLVLSLLILAIHFSRHSFTTSGMGNQVALPPLEAPATYR